MPEKQVLPIRSRRTCQRVYRRPFIKGPISLVNLATHRSGLPRDLYTDSFSDIYAWLNGFRPNIAPGSEYIYSNLGYEILGDILARQANSDYGTLAFESVSQPLGLLDTREILTDDERSRLAKGYGYDGSPMDYEPEFWRHEQRGLPAFNP